MIANLSAGTRRELAVWLLCVSSLTLLLSTARAQHADFTLESVERVALERSPRLQRARASLKVAHAHRAHGRMPRAGNPLLNLRAMVGRPDDPAATYSVMLGVPLDLSGKRPAWRREASFVVAQAEAELATVANEVRALAREAYVEVALAEAARKVAQESAATAEELVTRVQARLAQSAATALDVGLAETQLSEARADVARAERALVDAHGSLRQLLDLPPSAIVAVDALAAPELPRELSLDEAVARAVRERQEVRAFASERDRHRAADRRLRAEATAPVTFGLEAERQGNRYPNSSVGANLGLELPVVLRNQAERAVNAEQGRAAELERELAEHRVAIEAATSYRSLEAALHELGELETRALPAAERTLVMVHTMLDAGAVDYFRLLAARASAFALRSRRVETLRQAWLSRIALERAIAGWKETR